MARTPDEIDALSLPPGPYDGDGAEDLWFLPDDTDAGTETPASAPGLVDAEAWRAAEAAVAVDLAELAFDAGRLAERLRSAGQGAGQRLALAEAASLSWWTGDRVGADRLALWTSYRIGATEDDGGGLIRTAWAARRLGATPAAPARREATARPALMLTSPRCGGPAGRAPSFCNMGSLSSCAGISSRCDRSACLRCLPSTACRSPAVTALVPEAASCLPASAPKFHPARLQGPAATAAAGRGRGLTGTAAPAAGSDDASTVHLRDVVAVLERDPMYCRSPMLYRLLNTPRSAPTPAAAAQ